ncbi:hypothetical protein D3C85_1757410 [compost metagenome]
MHVGVDPAGAQAAVTRQIQFSMGVDVIGQLPHFGNLAVFDRQIHQPIIRQSGACDY